MTLQRIAVLPGDGIGPEVVKEGVKVLQVLEKLDSTLSIELEHFSWNSEYYLKHGRMMPENGLDTLKEFDAIFFGAIGDKRVAEHIPIWDLIMPIRKEFQQYVNLRPVKQLIGIKSPLANKAPIDFTIIRENAEGEYSNIGGHIYSGTEQEMAIQNTVITKQGVEKVTRFAFDFAKKNGQSKVTNATKSNAIIHSMKLWDDVVNEVAASYNDIKLENIYIDALAAYLVMQPENYEVIVASNLFGDILSDLGAGLVGGLGFSPSANLNPEGDFPSMFEPVHGSAPDIAHKGIANPIAQIWSLSLMLEHLGHADLAQVTLCAIESVLEAGVVKTPDLGGAARTEDMGDAIIKAIYEQN